MEKTKKAFTLIELLIVMIIFIILILWFSSMNLTSLSQKEKAEAFNNRVAWIMEYIRNNAMIWKWVKEWTQLFIPKQWKINFKKNDEIYNMTTSYSWSSNWEKLEDYKLKIWKFEKIDEVWCWSFTWTIDIIFEWNTASLSGSNCKNETTLEIHSSYREFKNKIKFDTISWLITKEKIKD